jgi:glucosyl-3-phosphoglycerate synthase
MLQPVVTVVIPARNEASTVGDIVRAVLGLRRPVGEVVVVDDGSTDGTAAVAAEAGATVVTAATTLPEFGTGPGKGQAMWKGLAESAGDVIVFCDADLRGFDGSFVTRLADALVASPGAAIAKGRYSERAGTGGRVNELVARPALELLHPLLADLAQPLGGEYAIWRDVAEELPFVHGYGVDLGLVLDIADRFGAEAIVEADLGVRTHRNRSLDELRPQARIVLEVALQRAGMLASSLPECPPLRTVAGYERRTA